MTRYMTVGIFNDHKKILDLVWPTWENEIENMFFVFSFFTIFYASFRVLSHVSSFLPVDNF